MSQLVDTAMAAHRFDHPVDAVRDALGAAEAEVIETPLSIIILTDRHAFKIKRAVDLGEAQFRSPAKRRQACIEEIWRNRRLAPGVYLGVVPITSESNGELRLGGKGTEIEWVVRMRRLRADRNMLTLIQNRGLRADQVAELAQTLADFYRGGPPETDQLDELCGRLHRRINDAARQLVELLPARSEPTVRRVREVQRDFLAIERMALNLRVCDGRIVDGHGDLHPEHVFLERQPLVIDCIEYSATLRKLDSLDDLARFAMECEHLGREDVADEMLSAYRRVNADDGFPHLEAFYKSLHACTRAAYFAGLRQNLDRAASRSVLFKSMAYLDQARHYCHQIA